MENPYKMAWEQVTAPDRLIRETAGKMMQAKAAPIPKKRRYAAAVSLAAVCFTAFMLYHHAGPQQTVHLNAGNGSDPIVSSTPSADGDSIYFNKLSSLRREAALIHGPMITHRETWTLAQYIDMIGTDPRPAFLPDGFIRNEPVSGEIAFQRDIRCDFYNTWSFSYEAQDGRKIMVFVNPSAIPYWASLRSYRLEDDRKPQELSALGESSLISGIRVTLWHLDQGEGWDYGLGNYRTVTDYYCADFWYRDTGFTITAENGVEEEELIAVIKSLLP